MRHSTGIAYIIAIGLSCLVCSSLTLDRLADNPQSLDAAETVLRTKRNAAPKTPQELQESLFKIKAGCARKLGFPPNIQEKVLLHEQNPTPKEQCLMECILKGANLMDDSNKISVEKIAELASMISGKNDLVIAIASVTAQNCNRRVVAKHPCEAANQINKCIGRELTTHRVKLFY